jgi:hypothetical protein
MIIFQFSRGAALSNQHLAFSPQTGAVVNRETACQIKHSAISQIALSDSFVTSYSENAFASPKLSTENPCDSMPVATPTRTLTQRLQFEVHQGRRVLLIDYSHCDAPQMTEIIALTGSLIATQLPSSVLTLSDVTGATFNTEVVEQLKELAKHNAPYVRKAAIIGVTGLQAFIYSVVQTFSKRNMPIFSSKEEALKYLLTD